MSEEDFREVGRALVEKAKSGHLGAIKLLLAYFLGKPRAMAQGTDCGFTIISTAEASERVASFFGN